MFVLCLFQVIDVITDRTRQTGFSLSTLSVSCPRRGGNNETFGQRVRASDLCETERPWLKPAGGEQCEASQEDSVAPRRRASGG